MKVLIVTVGYNPPASVINNLAVDYYPHLVIDNSEQESIWLKEYCAANGQLYQWLGGNLGIAKALNVGAEYALSCGYDYIVTMDQDSILTNSLLSKMTDFILTYSPKDIVAIFSPRHVTSENDQSETKLGITNGFYSMSSGNFLYLKAWQDLGGFDEKLFIDMVDIDFYAKALINSYKVLTIQNITLHHSMGDKSHIRWFGKYALDVWNHNQERKYYQARNYFYVYHKYSKQLPEIVFIKQMIRKMPIAIILFETNKLAKLYYFVRGYIDFLRNKFGKIYF